MTPHINQCSIRTVCFTTHQSRASLLNTFDGKHTFGCHSLDHPLECFVPFSLLLTYEVTMTAKSHVCISIIGTGTRCVHKV